MTSLPAKVIAIEKQGDQYRLIVQVSTKYRGSFNTLAFGEIKPYSGSLKDGRLHLVYYRDPDLEVGTSSRFGLCGDGFRIVHRTT
jgi:hypothetical protein